MFANTPTLSVGHDVDIGSERSSRAYVLKCGNLDGCGSEKAAFNLSGAYSTFRARIGVWDSPDNGLGSAPVQVLVDGQVVFERQVSRGGGANVSLSVKGAQRLELSIRVPKGPLVVAIGDPTVAP